MSGIYQHFRPEEKDFIDQVIGWQQYVENTYADKLTDFLDPRQQFIVRSIIGEQNAVRYQFFGGIDNCERKRALIYPEYMTPDEADYQIGLYEIKYPTKFVQLDHRMVLGSIMSLGMKRDKFGDILINDEVIQFFLATEIEDFVKINLTQIGKAKVTIKRCENELAINTEDKWLERDTTVSSLRLDSIISSAYNISRQKAQLLIQQGHAKVNWEKIERTSFECDEGDVLSVRGFGRCTIKQLQGRTKKDKYRVKIGLKK
ncbi:RNA-binding protein [Lederbergia graminis]|uniref:RNA-binding protein n=1 Tax=Lederbergia graminis TaxID=735518 RepID=A0ABW0LDN0_9BACI